MKPILFNTEMVRAILGGRKVVTRRVVRPQPVCYGPNITFAAHDSDFFLSAEKQWLRCRVCGNDPEYSREGTTVSHHWKPPYHPGDILWVRETWHKDTGRYMYKANYADNEQFFRDGNEVSIKWHPSIHMPKEAARLFLRVTGVRVERLQDITDDQCKAEGIVGWSKDDKLYKYAPADSEGDGPAWKWSECPATPQGAMKQLWNSTIKPADLPRHGWEANPWVWVIEFERISKEAALGGGGDG